MPFYLYSFQQNKGYREYFQKKEIRPFAGRGPLSRSIQRGIPPNVTTYKWHHSSDDIIRELGADPSSHEIIIDLKPNDKKNVSLYLLKDVWGYSYEEWTPIAVLLQSLYVEFSHENPSRFKRSFDDRNAENDLIGEFLYLRGGTKGGNWGWGPVGSVNGVLLWKESFRYLTVALSKHLYERESG